MVRRLGELIACRGRSCWVTSTKGGPTRSRSSSATQVSRRRAAVQRREEGRCDALRRACGEFGRVDAVGNLAGVCTRIWDRHHRCRFDRLIAINMKECCVAVLPRAVMMPQCSAASSHLFAARLPQQQRVALSIRSGGRDADDGIATGGPHSSGHSSHPVQTVPTSVVSP